MRRARNVSFFVVGIHRWEICAPKTPSCALFEMSADSVLEAMEEYSGFVETLSSPLLPRSVCSWATLSAVGGRGEGGNGRIDPPPASPSSIYALSIGSAPGESRPWPKSGRNSPTTWTWATQNQSGALGASARVSRSCSRSPWSLRTPSIPSDKLSSPPSLTFTRPPSKPLIVRSRRS